MLASIAAIFFTLPLVGLLWRAPLATLWDELTAPPILTALRLSLVCSIAATVLAVLFGLPLAWIRRARGFAGNGSCAR